MAVKPIPDGYPQIIPALSIEGAAEAIEFYRSVLRAEVRTRMDTPDGKVGHAELALGGSLLMVSDDYPEMGYRGPRAVGGSPVMISVYTPDVDAVFARALAAGAKELRPVADQFYGDRSGQFEDPWGHRWNVATHIEDVNDEEMTRRLAEFNESVG